MALGQSENSNRIFLHITYGKLRFKTNENDSQAVSRENSKGNTVWERVFDFVSGKVTSIFYKEDEKYGNSFEVTLKDGEEKYQISFSEGDNYCNDFFSKLPNVDLNREIKIAPYDFLDKSKNKQRRGITLWQDDVKINNFFVYREGQEFKYNQGFPKPEGTETDSDDWKIYFTKVKKFLRKYVNENIIPKFKTEEHTEEVSVGDLGAVDNNDDLPF